MLYSIYVLRCCRREIFKSNKNFYKKYQFLLDKIEFIIYNIIKICTRLYSRTHELQVLGVFEILLEIFMARKNNHKFTLAVLSDLSVLGSQSLAMDIGDKVNSRGVVQFVWEKDVLFFRLWPKVVYAEN